MMIKRLDRNARTIRLLIVDGLAHSRNTLADYLQLQENLEVVGETATAAGAMLLSRQHRPDVVITDANPPDCDGFETARRLRSLEQPPAVILLAVRRRPGDLRRAREAGAAAYIEKSAGVDAILSALQALPLSPGGST